MGNMSTKTLTETFLFLDCLSDLQKTLTKTHSMLQILYKFCRITSNIKIQKQTEEF